MCVWRQPKLYLVFFLLVNLGACVHQQTESAPPISEVSLKPSRPNLAALADETLADSSHAPLHLYFEGLQFRAQGNYDKALECFNQFLNQNPDHLYADRAQHLIVDSYFQSREYHLAVVASHQMEKQFPESQKLPETLYKRALSHLAVGQRKLGVDTLQFIIQEFSRNAASELARDKLNEIEGVKEPA